MLLNNRARDLLDNYTAGMAQHFGTQNPGRYFSLNDPQETALRLAMLESVEFLNWITSLDVDQLSGQVVNVGASVLHTGRSETGRFVRQVGVDGNTYSLVETDTRSFLMEYNGAQAETGINTPAETWQIDFTARMAGMDERQRLENIDLYGAAAFLGNGYLVAKSGSQYFVTAGSGYVRGLRAQLAANGTWYTVAQS